MAIGNYGALKAAVADWMHRDDIIIVMPAFVALAESEMWPVLEIRDQERRATASITDRFVELPEGFIKMRRLKAVAGGEAFDVQYMAPESLYQKPTSGIPAYFTVTNQIEFDVIPSGCTFDMQYFIALDPLSDDAPTNAVLTRFPNIYLFGSLAHAYDYALQEDKAQYFNGKFMSAIKAANALDSRGRTGPVPVMRSEGSHP